MGDAARIIHDACYSYKLLYNVAKFTLKCYTIRWHCLWFTIIMGKIVPYTSPSPQLIFKLKISSTWQKINVKS